MRKARRLAVKKSGERKEPSRMDCHEVQFLKTLNPHPTQMPEDSLLLENLVAILNLSKIHHTTG